MFKCHICDILIEMHLIYLLQLSLKSEPFKEYEIH